MLSSLTFAKAEIEDVKNKSTKIWLGKKGIRSTKSERRISLIIKMCFLLYLSANLPAIGEKIKVGIRLTRDIILADVAVACI